MGYDFSPLYRSTIGFDRLLDTFGRQLDADAAPGWPPYDIERVSEDSYRISLALAGFASDEIELIQKENELTVQAVRTLGTKRRNTCIAASQIARSS